MSAFKRNCRELSIEYLNSPEIDGVCEISSKEHEGPSSFRLKAPHSYARYKGYHNKSVRQCPPRRAVILNSKCFYVFPCSPYVVVCACLFCHSALVRLWRGRSLRRNSSSNSSRSLQPQPHHQCFDCRRHGLLVVLLVLCDTCSVAILLVW